MVPLLFRGCRANDDFIFFFTAWDLIKSKFHAHNSTYVLDSSRGCPPATREVIENHFKSTFTSADEREIIVIGIIIAGGVLAPGSRPSVRHPRAPSTDGDLMPLSSV